MLLVRAIVLMVLHKATRQQVLTAVCLGAARGASAPYGAAAHTMLAMKLLRVNAHCAQRSGRHVFRRERNVQSFLKILR